MSSLYLHVPFCRSKCHYCSFTSIAGCEGLYRSYSAALKKELSSVVIPAPLKTIFIGGGTPTILPTELLIKILDQCSQVFRIAAGAEISVEANPGTVDEDSLQALVSAGVNRLSLGTQSLDDRDLKILGRIHTAGETRAAVRAARRAGIMNLNLDLMCGLPGQTVASWQKTLDQALSLQPDHLSVYQLTIEDDTPFAEMMKSGRLALPNEETVIEMDLRTIASCRTAGIEQYEISNYARPGFECRHNINYWENREYIACGAAAVSYVGGVREKRIGNVHEYIERISSGLPVIEESERLSLEAAFRETVIMGLRLIRGVRRDSLRRRYGKDVDEYYGHTLENLLNQGLVKLTITHLHLTERGRLLANQVMADLV